jgi:metal-responsive CopG/Arc/MetJ family transcriptional regulator
MKAQATNFSQMVAVKAPESLVVALDLAAKQRFQSRSEYTRQALVQRLERDGICPVAENNG